jgi:hypothetical protein
MKCKIKSAAYQLQIDIIASVVVLVQVDAISLINAEHKLKIIKHAIITIK